MRILTLLTSLSLSLLLNAQSPTFEWAQSMGSSGGEFGMNVATDSSGNIYSIGFFSNNVDFDPGSGTTNLSSNGGVRYLYSKVGS